jgi:DNA-binding SARP family transcriptional activator
MACDMSFGILGPLQVSVDHYQITIPAGKQRILLATLLFDANQVVPIEELFERLWYPTMPRSPRAALHTTMTRLKRSLGADADLLIQQIGEGYQLELEPESLDLMRFRALVEDAKALAGRDDLAAESAVLTEALGLWRGPAMHDVRSASLLRDVIPGLVEEQLRALERYHDVNLGLGRAQEIVADLRRLIQQYPYHERFRLQLMLALARCGRQADALEVYAEVRDSLRDELGIDPGGDLRELQLTILRSEPA